jgi:hypothetical protein
METPPRKLLVASDAAREALGFGSDPDDKVPWDEIAARFTELLRLIFSALKELVGELVDRVGAIPAVAVIAVLVFLSCCCCQFWCQCCCPCCCVSGAHGEGPTGPDCCGSGAHGEGPTGRWSSRPPEASTGPTGVGEEIVTDARGCDHGPDGEEVVVTATGGGDGPVVRYHQLGGGLFSMHPDKPVMR